MTHAPCPDCGAAFAPADIAPHAYLGGSTGRRAAFSEVMALEFQDPAYFPAPRLSVDAYAAQPPGDPSDRRAIQSATVRLAAPYVLLEEGRDAVQARARLTPLAAACKDRFRPLAPPAPEAYALTVKDALAAAGAPIAVVRRWAGDVRRAWAAPQDRVKGLARLASPQ